MNTGRRANSTSSRAKLRTIKLPDNAHSASDATQVSVPQRTVAASPNRLMSFDAIRAPAR